MLVEGIDAVTSTTIQVRHSYKAEDIMFDHRHVNCVDVDPATGGRSSKVPRLMFAYISSLSTRPLNDESCG